MSSPNDVPFGHEQPNMKSAVCRYIVFILDIIYIKIYIYIAIHTHTHIYIYMYILRYIYIYV